MVGVLCDLEVSLIQNRTKAICDSLLLCARFVSILIKLRILISPDFVTLKIGVLPNPLLENYEENEIPQLIRMPC